MTAELVVVEDDVTVLTLLGRVLEAEGYRVRRFASSDGAAVWCREHRPQGALIDVGLGGEVDGLSLVRQIRDLGDTSIVIVSGRTEPEDIQAGFAAGADMYVEKPFASEKLVARLAGLLGRRSEPRIREWRVADITIDSESRTIARSGRELYVPKREFDLLCALARHPGKILTKAQLLSEVWGYHGYDHNVVERRISSLRRRLEAHGPRVIHTVPGCGYLIRS